MGVDVIAVVSSFIWSSRHTNRWVCTSPVDCETRRGCIMRLNRHLPSPTAPAAPLDQKLWKFVSTCCAHCCGGSLVLMCSLPRGRGKSSFSFVCCDRRIEPNTSGANLGRWILSQVCITRFSFFARCMTNRQAAKLHLLCYWHFCPPLVTPHKFMWLLPSNTWISVVI